MKRSVLSGILVALVAGILAYAYWWNDESKLKADIEAMSKSGRVGNYMRSFDYVCFSPNTNYVPEAFGEALKSSGLDPYISLNACGIRGTCCNMDSNYSAVGLIKDGEIRCLEIRQFLFIPDDDRTFCARPSELQVSLETFEAPEGRSSPPFISRGTQFYRIRRGKK